ncbi:MAG: CBS domain-containing protein [Desulfococcaceae bacterium]
MGIVEHRSVPTGVRVREAMRRQVIRIDRAGALGHAVNRMIKFKVNALLVSGEGDVPAGVLSKTDLMGAYYAGLPVETEAGDIMAAPPRFIGPEDTLETALETMRASGIYRLYVRQGEDGPAEGVIAYPDIVGLLYRFCRDCEHSRVNRARRKAPDAEPDRLRVRDVMTASVESVTTDDPIAAAIELLSAYRFGAVLVAANNGDPAGVVSKTDLILAYRRGVDTGVPAREIMSAPVRACDPDDFLESTVRELIFGGVQRVFVREAAGAAKIGGVLSLSDAARARSGSCHACVSSRIRVEAAE